MNRFKRVILITVDCLRGDHVGYISGCNLTPNIDRVAKDSVVFTRAFSNGPGTNQSFPAILTSTYFLIHGGLRLNPYCTTIAEVLESKGFKTVAFHSNPFLSKVLGWNRGFNEFYDFMDVIKSPSAFVTKQQGKGLTGRVARFAGNVLGAGRSHRVQRLLKKVYYKFSSFECPYLEGRELNKHVMDWLERNSDEKFFLWMHYMDPHDPYIPPEDYLLDFSSREEAFDYNLSIDTDNLSEENIVTLKRLYEGEVRYTDACIGDFLYYLEEKKLLDNSLIIITGDHGHAFMEHGKFAHAYDILYNEVIHVPLIMYGLDKVEKFDVKVELLDVSPTMLALMGIRKPPTFLGNSLLSVMDGARIKKPIFSESAVPDLINLKYNIEKKAFSCIFDSYKIIVNEMRNSIELYDIDGDFEENNNVVECEENTVAQLKKFIQTHAIKEKIFKMKVHSLYKKTL